MTDLAPAFSLDELGTTLVPLLPMLRLLVTWRGERQQLGDDPSGGAVLAKAMLEACILDLETTLHTSAMALLPRSSAARDALDGYLRHVARAGDDRTPPEGPRRRGSGRHGQLDA